MGCNYYWIENKCECCGRQDELHIGKSSAGWQFTFRGYEYENIHSYKDWVNRLTNTEGQIVDEYGHEHTIKDLLDLIARKKRDDKLHNGIEDGEGYHFTYGEFC